MESVPSLVDVVSLLAVGVGLGPLISWLLERATWFQKVKPAARLWTVFGVCVVLPVVARLLLSLIPPEVWAMLEPYWQALAAGFAVFAASQGYHLLQKKATAA